MNQCMNCGEYTEGLEPWWDEKHQEVVNLCESCMRWVPLDNCIHQWHCDDDRNCYCVNCGEEQY